MCTHFGGGNQKDFNLPPSSRQTGVNGYPHPKYYQVDKGLLTLGTGQVARGLKTGGREVQELRRHPRQEPGRGGEDGGGDLEPSSGGRLTVGGVRVHSLVHGVGHERHTARGRDGRHPVGHAREEGQERHADYFVEVQLSYQVESSKMVLFSLYDAY